MPDPLKVFAVDGNWYLHRVFHTAHTHDNLPQRFLQMICRDALDARCTTLMVAFDGARVFRHKLYSQYKASRKQDKEARLIPDGAVEEGSPYLHLPAVCAYLGLHGVPNVQYDLYEADDVLTSVAHAYPGTVIGSRDKDLYQALVTGAVLFDSSAKKDGVRAPVVMHAADVERKLGVLIHQTVDYQTLIGDGIDDIPRVMTPKQAVAGLKLHDNINAWAAADADARKLFKARKAELVLNRKLVRLVTDIPVRCTPIQWAVSAAAKTPSSYIALRDFCQPKSKGLFRR